MAEINTFEDLYKLGWRRRSNKDRTSYDRPKPPGGIVSRRGDLSKYENRILGDILYPASKGRRGPTLPVTVSSLSAPSTSSRAEEVQPDITGEDDIGVS